MGFLASLSGAASGALTPHASATDIAGAVASQLAGGKGAAGALDPGSAGGAAAMTTPGGSPITLKYQAVL